VSRRRGKQKGSSTPALITRDKTFASFDQLVPGVQADQRTLAFAQRPAGWLTQHMTSLYQLILCRIVQ
jgi:hypothetical protein